MACCIYCTVSLSSSSSVLCLWCLGSATPLANSLGTALFHSNCSNPRVCVVPRALAIHYFTVLIIIFPLLRVGLSFRYIVCCFLVWLMANARFFFLAFWSRNWSFGVKVLARDERNSSRRDSCVVGLVRARKQHRSTVDHRSIKRSRVCWLMFCEVILKLSFFSRFDSLTVESEGWLCEPQSNLLSRIVV